MVVGGRALNSSSPSTCEKVTLIPPHNFCSSVSEIVVGFPYWIRAEGCGRGRRSRYQGKKLGGWDQLCTWRRVPNLFDGRNQEREGGLVVHFLHVEFVSKVIKDHCRWTKDVYSNKGHIIAAADLVDSLHLVERLASDNDDFERRQEIVG